jgi:hypothetical protein
MSDVVVIGVVQDRVLFENAGFTGRSITLLPGE